MSVDCNTEKLATLMQCSPVREVTEQQTQMALTDTTKRSLVIKIAYKHLGTSTQYPYGKHFADDGKVVVDSYKKNKENKRRNKSDQSVNRLLLGFLPTGQKLVLTNCPMTSRNNGSLPNTSAKTES
ncbi:Protein CBG27639 [Caenorhabditis briggsae]|uniref:Protein CBG27639 n=2 Tax=Caenorhabditis briggsae TaxID=6238 RepID=B6IJ84_CAEBR|nr:Protein CBG27639 [Caenorhabditis briggsae]ULT81728.1 hypothetical protein L3Y34_011597 [Caenorhabditis briggsae]CAR99918.1 Protein CBG27639 [Caenorhabditis briggsae]